MAKLDESWRISSYNIDALQSKVVGSGEEVTIVGIDFLKSMFRRASELEGIGGAEEGGRWCRLESFFQSRLDFIGERTPDKMTGMLLQFKLVHGEQISFGGEPVLTESPVQRGNNLCLSMPGRCQSRGFGGEFTDLLKTGIFQIKPNQVAGVKE